MLGDVSYLKFPSISRGYIIGHIALYRPIFRGILPYSRVNLSIVLNMYPNQYNSVYIPINRTKFIQIEGGQGLEICIYKYGYLLPYALLNYAIQKPL